MARRVGLLAVLASLAFPGGASAAVFSNSDPIAMPDNSVANPYPSTIPVSGMSGNVTRVKVTLAGIVAAARDVDVLLVSPAGTAALVLSDTCAGSDFSNKTFTFDDAAVALIGPGPCIGIPDGTWKPSNYDFIDSFPGAPAGPYAIGFSTFSGAPANGSWRLYVVDDQGPDAGSINGGWSLDVTTDAPPPAAKKKCKKKGKKAAAAKKKRCGKKKKR